MRHTSSALIGDEHDFHNASTSESACSFVTFLVSEGFRCSMLRNIIRLNVLDSILAKMVGIKASMKYETNQQAYDQSDNKV